MCGLVIYKLAVAVHPLNSSRLIDRNGSMTTEVCQWQVKRWWLHCTVSYSWTLHNVYLTSCRPCFNQKASSKINSP